MQTNKSSEKIGCYVDKHCDHDSDTKYIGDHQHYRNKLNTHLGEEAEDKIGSGRRRRRRRSWRKRRWRRKGWTKCRTAIDSWRTKKSVSCKHGLFWNQCLPDKGYVFQMRVARSMCTSCKPGTSRKRGCNARSCTQTTMQGLMRQQPCAQRLRKIMLNSSCTR